MNGESEIVRITGSEAGMTLLTSYQGIRIRRGAEMPVIGADRIEVAKILLEEHRRAKNWYLMPRASRRAIDASVVLDRWTYPNPGKSVELRASEVMCWSSDLQAAWEWAYIEHPPK